MHTYIYGGITKHDATPPERGDGHTRASEEMTITVVQPPGWEALERDFERGMRYTSLPKGENEDKEPRRLRPQGLHVSTQPLCTTKKCEKGVRTRPKT